MGGGQNSAELCRVHFKSAETRQQSEVSCREKKMALQELYYYGEIELDRRQRISSSNSRLHLITESMQYATVPARSWWFVSNLSSKKNQSTQ